MCVAIYKPAGVILEKGDIMDMYFQNSDGFGAAWVQGGEVQTFRALPHSEEEAWQMYSDLKLTNQEAILHYRMATHGSVRVENSHPFEVLGGLVMIHNGVLDVSGLSLDCSGDRTDTAAYIEAYIRPLLAQVKDPFDFVASTPFVDIIGEHIGANKFVFMDYLGRVSIANYSMGSELHRKGGKFWASNTHWEYAISDYYRYGNWGKGKPKRKGKRHNGNKAPAYVYTQRWEDKNDFYLPPYDDIDRAVNTPLITDEDDFEDEWSVYDTAEYCETLREACMVLGVNTWDLHAVDIEDYMIEHSIDGAWDILDRAMHDRSKLQSLVDDIMMWGRELREYNAAKATD